MPILKTLTKPRSNRIDALQKQIKWIENHIRDSSDNNAKADANIKELKAELAALLEEDAKYDKLRNLPLYSCRITGWKFVLYVQSVMIRSTY
jgi:septal ring factor EnvC (AmiA/AmiB activator)